MGEEGLAGVFLPRFFVIGSGYRFKACGLGFQFGFTQGGRGLGEGLAPNIDDLGPDVLAFLNPDRGAAPGTCNARRRKQQARNPELLVVISECFGI